MNQKNTFGLTLETLEKLRAVFRKRAGVQKALVYGSRAKGNYKPGSDIDIALVAPALNLTDLLKIESEIDDLLLPYKVDLSLLHQVEDANLLDHIKRVGLVLFTSS
jgi:predicted nucleotidyltransferase